MAPNPLGIQNHHGISDPESDSPRLCFFRILVGVEVQLSRIPANSETAPAGMYRDATPMYSVEAERVHVVLSRESGLPVSVLALPRDRDPGFTRAPMSTGAPNKARGRSA